MTSTFTPPERYRRWVNTDVARIAANTGMTRAEVRKSLRDLDRQGLIERSAFGFARITAWPDDLPLPVRRGGALS